MIDQTSVSPPPKSGLRRRIDQAGIGLAGLCALHCVATILIVSGLGVGGHFLLAPEIHEVGLVLAVIVAALAIGWGVWRHRRLSPALVASLGLAFMASALFVGHGPEEAVLTIIGVVIVSIGHLMNMRGHS
ncbi:MAG: MerC domain-containing protein [Pseudomonadota bacterium]